MDLIEQINAHNCLFLVHIEEPEDNLLRFVIEEGRPSDIIEDIEGGKIKGVQAVISADECAAYDVVFDDYIVYSIRNESYTYHDDYEIYTGQLFRIYEQSHFLDYLRKATFANKNYPGSFKHYGFVCTGHIIDVASVSAPIIKQIRGA